MQTARSTHTPASAAAAVSAARLTPAPSQIGPAAVPVQSPLATPQESFVGEGITPEDESFATASMAAGAPGLPRTFSWHGRKYSVLQILESWKEAGNCRHGSGERYIRKHWFRVRTSDSQEMKIYFERQARSSGGARWRLYSIRHVPGG